MTQSCKLAASSLVNECCCCCNYGYVVSSRVRTCLIQEKVYKQTSQSPNTKQPTFVSSITFSSWGQKELTAFVSVC